MSYRQRSVLLALGRHYDHHIHRSVVQYAARHHWHLNGEMGISGRLPLEWKGNGILTALDVDKDLVRFCLSARVPVVDLSLVRQDLQLPRVVGDHWRMGQLAAEHFLERGFRQFAWFSEGDSPVMTLRRRGFAETLARHGMTSREWTWKPAGSANPWAAKSAWLARQLEAIPKPAAVFAWCDMEAVDVLDVCLREGFAVPDEVAVLGVDNNELICESLRVPLSSVYHDLESLGYEGAALLDRLMNGQRAPRRPILIPPKGIVTRRSTEVLAIHHEPSRRALRFLRENFRRKDAVTEAVEAGGCPRAVLEKAFREHLDRLIMQELTRIRLARSRELLLQTDLSMADVAAATGFNTAQYFNNVFRKATGRTPRRFRVSNQKAARQASA